MTPMKNLIRSYGYSFNNLGDTLYKVKKMIYPDEWRRNASAPHSHDYPEIWYCLEGEFAMVLDGNEYQITQGQFVAVPIGMTHQVLTPEGTVAEIFILSMRYDIFNSALSEKYLNAKAALFLHSFLKKPAPKPVTLCKKSRSAVNELISELSYRSFSPVCEEKTCELIEAIFSLPELSVELMEKEIVKELWSEKVIPILRAMGYINEKYNERITSDDLLRVSAMGYSTFFTAFKTFLDRPFLAYLQQIRLLRCHVLFASTTYSMAYIATLCGFSNQSHMIRNYKKYAGVLPKNARAHSYAVEKERRNKETT